MDKVKHKIFGEGIVIKRNCRNIIVRFQDDTEKTFVIPDSFKQGFLTAEGLLKDEIDQEIRTSIIKNVDENKQLVENAQSKNINRKNSKKPVLNIEIKGKIESAYEAYLIEAGYKTTTDKGSPSTVYSYLNAIGFVLDEEKLSWAALVNKIDDVIILYDIGGEKEHLGNKSNRTCINALKRFQDFSKIMQD